MKMKYREADWQRSDERWMLDARYSKKSHSRAIMNGVAYACKSTVKLNFLSYGEWKI